jgi:hypothetical protein
MADVDPAQLCELTATFIDAGGTYLNGVRVRFSPALSTGQISGVGFVGEDVTAASEEDGSFSMLVVRGLTGLLTVSGTDLVRRVIIPDQETIDVFELLSTGTDLLEVQELELVELPRRS